jgi:Zn-dependent protease with chaperone function
LLHTPAHSQPSAIPANLLATLSPLQVLLLENMGTSLKAGPDQLPSLHRLLTEAAAILQMDAPDLYVRQNPVPNAYTLAIAGRKPFVVVHTALLELLTPEEVQVSGC